jgi:hypothetical protein
MNADRDLSKKEQEQKKAAELEVVKKISSEIPCLFHDAEERAWATVLDNGHQETYAVDSLGMRKYLEGLYYKETKRNSGQGEAIPEELLKKTLNRLRVMAIHDGEEKKVFLRVGAENTRVLYIDLCDKQKTVVRISRRVGIGTSAAGLLSEDALHAPAACSRTRRITG